MHGAKHWLETGVSEHARCEGTCMQDIMVVGIFMKVYRYCTHCVHLCLPVRKRSLHSCSRLMFGMQQKCGIEHARHAGADLCPRFCLQRTIAQWLHCQITGLQQLHLHGSPGLLPSPPRHEHLPQQVHRHSALCIRPQRRLHGEPPEEEAITSSRPSRAD